MTPCARVGGRVGLGSANKHYTFVRMIVLSGVSGRQSSSENRRARVCRTTADHSRDQTFGHFGAAEIIRRSWQQPVTV